MQFTRFVLAAVSLMFLGTSVGVADDLIDVGYVDQAVLSNLSSFNAAARELSAYKETLDRQFAAQMRVARKPADQQRLTREFSQKFDDRRRALLGPLLRRAQTAIASVASSKNLTVVVDKRIIIFGGQDITSSVVSLLSGIGDPVPPVSTSEPSKIGFVDQTRVDAIPKIKRAMDAFDVYRNVEEQHVQSTMRAAGTEAQRRDLFKAYQKRVADKQKQMILPLLDQTRGAITDVAKKKRLLLVVDRDDVIYGGTDVTEDVLGELGG
jgi:outer membrane protein